VLTVTFASRCRLLTLAGEKGKTPSGKPLHYKGSSFHRIVKDFMVSTHTPLFFSFFSLFSFFFLGAYPSLRSSTS